MIVESTSCIYITMMHIAFPAHAGANVKQVHVHRTLLARPATGLLPDVKGAAFIIVAIGYCATMELRLAGTQAVCNRSKTLAATKLPPTCLQRNCA
jgi:hypothetical protein